MSSKSSASSAMDKFVEFASKVGAQRHLAALRDGFVSIMPIIIAGSIAHILILQIPLSLNPQPGIEVLTWRGFLMEHVPWFVDICLQVWWATFGMISLYAVFSISYHLARSYDGNGLASGVVSLGAFATLIPQVVNVEVEGIAGSAWGNIGWGYVSANALFVGIIVAFLATEIFTRLCRTSKLTIKMPEGVPPAVSKSFASLFPGIITFFVIGSLGVFLGLIFNDNVFNLMTSLMAPIVQAADSLGAALGIVFMNQILWFFGLHGSNILEGVIQPVSLQLLSENLAAYNAGAATLPHIVTKPFLDAFVHLGGSGATLGMVAAILIVSRSKAQRTMGKLSIGPGVFNINEPMIFGMPIVLNFIFVIPFIFVPLILVVVSYLATSLGLVNASVAQIPWATPPLLSGWLVTGGDWRAIVLQLINIGITIACYIPFVKIADRAEIKKEQQALATAPKDEETQPNLAE